jgi:hypothetical protein
LAWFSRIEKVIVISPTLIELNKVCRCEKMLYRQIGAILLLAATSYSAAGAETVERTAQGETNKDIRIGVYVNIQRDCTSGPLPTLRLIMPPAHGKVTVKKANFGATNYKQCLALNVPAYVAFYRSEKDFLGNDRVVLEVRFPSGKQELQHIVIAGAGQPT